MVRESALLPRTAQTRRGRSSRSSRTAIRCVIADAGTRSRHVVLDARQLSGSRLRDTPGFTIFRQPSYIYNHIDFNLHAAGRSAIPAVREAACGYAIGPRRDPARRSVTASESLQDVTDADERALRVTSIRKTPFDIAQGERAARQGRLEARRRRHPREERTRLALDLYAVTAARTNVDEQIELIRADVEADRRRLSTSITYTSAIMFSRRQRKAASSTATNGTSLSLPGRTKRSATIRRSTVANRFRPNGQNNLRWCNQRAQAAMDALFGQFEQSQRNGDVLAIQQEFVKDVPSIVTYIRRGRVSLQHRPQGLPSQQRLAVRQHDERGYLARRIGDGRRAGPDGRERK